MDPPTTTGNAVILTDASHWHGWLAIIEANARQTKIWDYIDPSQKDEPTHPAPILPLRATAPGETDAAKNIAYQDLLQIYKEEKTAYNEREKALSATLRSIQNSISSDYMPYIFGKSSPYQALRALQEAIAPNSNDRLIEVDQQYRILCAGPTRAGNNEKWLQKWERVHAELTALGHADIQSGLILTHFIKSLKQVDPYWASAALHSLQDKQLNGLPNPKFMDIVKMYRQASQGNPESSEPPPASAATLQGRTPDPRPPRSRNASPASPAFRRCVCGRGHRYIDCYYIIEAKRPNGWKPNAEVSKRIEEALKDPKIKGNVERQKQIWKDTEEKKKSTSSSTEHPTQPQVNRTFATIWHGGNATDVVPSSYSVDKVINYEIFNCWILDSGSNIHVCNDPSRFKKTHATTSNDYLVSGSTTYPIKAYGTVDITINSPTGQTETITLSHVALVPGFFTNLVSFSRAKHAGIYWNTRKDTLYTEDGGRQDHFCSLRPYNGHWIVEYNDPPTTSTAYATSAASKTTCSENSEICLQKVDDIPLSSSLQICMQNATEIPEMAFSTSASAQPKIFEISPGHLHDIMGHAGAEAIARLPSAIDGLKLTSPCAQDEFRSCEACRLSKAHRVISRSSDSEVPATRPLQRIAYDLIYMDTAFNGHRYISHFVCMVTSYHWVWTHPLKSEAIKIFCRMVYLAEHHYGMPISFIRTDDEQALGKAFEDVCTEKGIISERTAPYTPAQNGKNERSGGVITTKARCMRIASNLPHNLWPETVSTAAYILNRTPVFKTGITPFESLYGKKPGISHMKTYGCRAYPLNYNIPKLQKLQPRAHLGYLVGYSSRNIYRIWVPSKKDVLRVRDVTFDEKTYYQPDDIDVAQLVQERDLHHAIQILQDIPNSLIAHNQDEQEIEIPAPFLATTATPSTNKQPDEATTTQTQAYMSPPPSDAGGSTSVPPPPPQNGLSGEAVGEDVGEGTGERIGARWWEYRLIGPTAPRATDISANLDDALILPTRTRNRQHAHAVALDTVDHYSGYHSAFATNLPPKLKNMQHRDSLPEEPKNWKSMLKHPHSRQFIQAANKEFEHLRSRGTFKLTARPTGKAVLPLIWVFKYKFDDAGYLIKHKARLCVRGDLQKTEQDTAAATLAIRVFRALMAITASFKLKAKQYDAVNAFINSAMNEEVFVDCPEGIQIPTDIRNPCFLLLRALYGLKQSPLLWLQEITSTLLDLGLYPIPGVDCLFINSWLILFFYVDDIVILYRAEDEAKFLDLETALLSKYEIRSLGDLSWFLGIRIIRTEDKLYLCQDSYIEKIVEKYSTTVAWPRYKTPLPMDELVQYDGIATKDQIYAYQQRIGSLTFAATTTRPDISFATAKLAQYLTNPSPVHLQAANRVISYLHHTKHLAIEFSQTKNNPIFLSSSDAAFADDSKTRKSSFGYLIQLFGGPIDWKASKQATVTTSSTEAELLALSETARQTLWWKRFFENIHFDTEQDMVINCDNQQTLGLIQNETPRLSTRLRHVDVHSCWLRQEVQERRIATAWIPTAKMPADGLTKTLPNQKHQNFTKLLNMVDVSKIVSA